MRHLVELPDKLKGAPTTIAKKDIRGVFTLPEKEGCFIIMADCNNTCIYTTKSADEVTQLWEEYLL